MKRICWHLKVSKVHNRLHHHVSIIKMARKHTWIIAFGAYAKKTTSRGLTQPKSRLNQLGQLPQMQESTSPLHSSRRSDRKTYMGQFVWSPDELIINFGSILPWISEANFSAVSEPIWLQNQFWTYFGRWKLRDYVWYLFSIRIRPPSSLYVRELRPIEFLSIQSSKHIHSNCFILFSNLPTVHPLIQRSRIAS